MDLREIGSGSCPVAVRGISGVELLVLTSWLKCTRTQKINLVKSGSNKLRTKSSVAVFKRCKYFFMRVWLVSVVFSNERFLSEKYNASIIVKKISGQTDPPSVELLDAWVMGWIPSPESPRHRQCDVISPVSLQWHLLGKEEEISASQWWRQGGRLEDSESRKVCLVRSYRSLYPSHFYKGKKGTRLCKSLTR
jgi:hypothetical protein